MVNWTFSMKKPLFVFIIFLLMVCWNNCALAEIKIFAAQKVAKGDGFVVETHTTTPTDFFIFNWNGKNIKIPAENTRDTLAAKNYHAKILLPVPLDEKSAKKSLSVTYGNSKNKSVATKNIEIVDKKRPIQKLNVDKKFVSPPSEVMPKIREDRQKVKQALSQNLSGRLWELPLERPVKGSVSSHFGLKRIFNGQPRGEHKGLDLRGAEGTPIKACSDGKVVLVDDLYYSGQTVYISHGDGVFSAYLHLSKPLVQNGENVVRGQTIGLVGSTGRVTGPHLHLSIFSQGQSIDPLPLLESESKIKKSNNGKNNDK